MASGSFNINAFSYRYQMPLSNSYSGFSTGTMFAVGPSTFLQNYSFYEYSYGLCGFPDTSTMSVSMTSLISTNQSTITGKLSNVVSYLSTDAVYNRVFNYTWPLASTFISTVSSIGNYPLVIDTPTLNLRSAVVYSTITMFDLVNSRAHNLVVEFDYNLMLYKGDDTFNWVSTMGFFNPYQEFAPSSRRIATTRVNVNSNYTTISPRLFFDTSDQNTIVGTVSTFSFKIVTLSNASVSSAVPTYSVYVPGNYNYSFTFYPLSNTYFAVPPNV